MIKLYQEIPKEIHYLGPKDTFSEILAEQIFVDGSSVVRIAQPNFQSIVDAVMANTTAVGLLAVENSTSSTVHENAEHIFGRRLSILSEATLAINMNLIGLREAENKGVRVVYSHKQALAQCRKYIERRRLEKIEVESTAEAAETVLQMGDPAVVCLGAARLVRRPGLAIIDKNVADYTENETKFFVVKRRDSFRDPPIPKERGKELRLTVLADVAHRKGTLSKILQDLAIIGGANLYLIESRPIPGNRNTKRFWLDMETESHKVKELIRNARNNTEGFEVLGIYNPPKTYQS